MIIMILEKRGQANKKLRPAASRLSCDHMLLNCLAGHAEPRSGGWRPHTRKVLQSTTNEQVHVFLQLGRRVSWSAARLATLQIKS